MSGVRVRETEAGDQCSACVASRKSIVDAYFDGYIAGSIEMAIVGEPGAKGVHFCLAHERMSTEALHRLQVQLEAEMKRRGLT